MEDHKMFNIIEVQKSE